MYWRSVASHNTRASMNPMMKRLFLKKNKAEAQTPKPVNKKRKLDLQSLADGYFETDAADA